MDTGPGTPQGTVARLILKQTCKESCCSALELWQEGWLGTGRLRDGENRQEAGMTGQTMTTGTHRDEIELKAQLELTLQKDGQEEGVTRTPVAKGSSEKWRCINGGI